MWRLDLDMDVVRNQAPRMDISPEEVSAEWVFDEGNSTWVIPFLESKLHNPPLLTGVKSLDRDFKEIYPVD